jgi:hypothetical protein
MLPAAMIAISLQAAADRVPVIESFTNIPLCFERNPSKDADAVFRGSNPRHIRSGTGPRLHQDLALTPGAGGERRGAD